MSPRSSLYVGSVMHHRLRPRPHRLRHRVFWMLLDLDELDALAKRSYLFSHNRFGIFSLHDADYGEESGRPLRQQVEAHLQQAGIEDVGRIQLLTMPRILGYTFNPLSVYFCRRADDSLAAILYEVHNTFAERHSYLIPVEDETADIIEQRCAKAFYVSPFLDMAIRYVFRVQPPADKVTVAIRGEDDEGPIIAASLSGQRRRFTDAALLRLLVTHPLLTLKVIGAIHWHALRMVLKGYRPLPRPRPPLRPVSVVGKEP